jgi:hypothetical protein
MTALIGDVITQLSQGFDLGPLIGVRIGVDLRLHARRFE